MRSRPSHWEVLARLRRMELDGSRRTLLQATSALATARAAAADLWRAAAGLAPGTEDGPGLHLRGTAIAATRQEAVRLDAQIARLQAMRDRLEERVRRELMACRQIDMVLEAQHQAQRQAQLRRQQFRSDARGMQGGPIERFPGAGLPAWHPGADIQGGPE